MLVYVPTGYPKKRVVRGTRQYDENVPVVVSVSNLNPDYKVAINWLAFLFRENGTPSPTMLDPPPGSHPDTIVGARQTYSHIFHFKSVLTYKSGTAVVNEVNPAVYLQCPVSSGNSGLSPAILSGRMPPQGSGNIQPSVSAVMAQVAKDFPIENAKNRHWSLNASSSCVISVREVLHSNPPTEWKLDLAQLLSISLVSYPDRSRGWVDIRDVNDFTTNSIRCFF